ncbi:MAG: alpha/beta hydrolase [Actinomycetota bacterium]|nr:alpha/beta hydrolase [Actinomycetota bacterium]
MGASPERSGSRRWVVGTAAVLAGLGVRAVLRERREQGEGQPGERPRRISWVGRKLDPYPTLEDQGLVLPVLPPAEIVTVPGRGEMFVRRTSGTSGTSGASEGGEGVPVLLLHGWMASADLNWFLLFHELSRHHPVIAPDLRGHGRGIRSHRPFSLEDCADDAAALLRHLGVERALVVGYSMGGPVAMLVWQRHPELVAGLVLEATALEFSGSPRERLVWHLTGPLGLLLRWPTGRIVLLRLTGGIEEVPTSLLRFRAWADGEFRRNDPTEVAEAGRALGRFDARPFAGSIDVPTAVVVTTKDSLVAPDKQRALARAVRAQVFEFAGDHAAVALQAGEFARVTLDAIATISPRTAGLPATP